MPSLTSSTLLTLLAATALGAAVPQLHNDHTVNKRTGTGVAALVGAVKGTASGRIPCANPRDVAGEDMYYLEANSTDGSVYATGCFVNSTEVDSGQTDDIWTFDENDLAVANCLTDLHYSQHFTCISVKGSSCDNGYHDSGGFILNARIPIVGAGDSKSAQLSAAQSSAAQGIFSQLVGMDLTITGDNPAIHFWDNTATNPEWEVGPGLQLNMVRGKTTHC